MTRKQREAQLYSLLATPAGRDELIATFINTTGQWPWVGMFASAMIEAVLVVEFGEEK